MLQKLSNISVTGLGMVTSISQDVINSCAAQRCMISGASEFEEFEVWDLEFEDNVPLIAHSVKEITRGYQGIGRWLRLCVLALKDLGRYSKLEKKSVKYWSKTGLLINGPILNNERYDVLTDLFENWPKCLLQYIDFPILPTNIYCYYKSNTGIIECINKSKENIFNGKWERAIVLGVDSYLDEESLIWLDENHCIKIPEKGNGLVPGEAAACFMLESEEEAKINREIIHCNINATNVATDERDENNKYFSGRELANSIMSTLNNFKEEKKNIGCIICDLNGEMSRSIQWGNALIRLNQQSILNKFDLIHPADSFGDTGAASGAISVCVGCRSFIREYSHGDVVLVWSSSDNGEVGSFILSRSN